MNGTELSHVFDITTLNDSSWIPDCDNSNFTDLYTFSLQVQYSIFSDTATLELKYDLKFVSPYVQIDREYM